MECANCGKDLTGVDSLKWVQTGWDLCNVTCADAMMAKIRGMFDGPA